MQPLQLEKQDSADQLESIKEESEVREESRQILEQDSVRMKYFSLLDGQKKQVNELIEDGDKVHENLMFFTTPDKNCKQMSQYLKYMDVNVDNNNKKAEQLPLEADEIDERCSVMDMKTMAPPSRMSRQHSQAILSERDSLPINMSPKAKTSPKAQIQLASTDQQNLLQSDSPMRMLL